MQNKGPDGFHSGKDKSFLTKEKEAQRKQTRWGHSAALYPAACSETVMHLLVSGLSPRLTLSHPRDFCFYFKLWSPPVSENQNHTPTVTGTSDEGAFGISCWQEWDLNCIWKFVFLFFQRSLWHCIVDTGMRGRTHYEVTEFCPVFF